ARRQPDREAVGSWKGRLTYAQLNERVGALASGLKAMGLGRGDIVALLLWNCPEFLEMVFAANRLGAVFLPLNYRLAPDELVYILNHAGARLLLTEALFHETVEGIRPQLTSVRTFLTLDDPPGAGWVNYGETVARHLGEDVPDAEVEPDDLHRLMYTSGTTARPKGVMITYGNLYWKNVSQVWEFDLTPDDRCLIVGPLYHVGGLDLPATSVLHRGGRVFILRRFDTLEVLEAIQREQPTCLWLAPAMINQLLNEPRLGEFSRDSVRFIIDGGEKMPIPLIQKLLDAFPRTWFVDAYGLTETVSGDTFLDKRMTLTKIGSVGRPTLHLDLRVVDDEGRELPPGQAGEVVLRGPKVFKGYWNDPEATAAAIRDGWFHTGDVGFLDEDGYLYIVDRKKDLIISGGENIASSEVERVLYEHPKVLEAAVVGMPDERWGEVPKAFVVLRPGEAATAEEIMDFCRGKLARFKVPKAVQFIDALPRNPSGKVLKRVLRQLAVQPPST
ncbi:MAG: long-chain fatty acid--CoA ligase, partial [Clostridia bacterium]|nr:long-chain fatty acid--CoA ligase [Clostridia bacterium]